MEAMEDAVELAGIAAIGKQERPAAAVSGQPDPLIRCGEGVTGS